MNTFNPFGGGGFPQFDPSKMDPKVLMQMTQLIQKLPHDQLSRMQTLMHNAMAGFDVKKEMEEFEKGLPPGFREQMTSLLMQQYAQGAAPQADEQEVPNIAPLQDHDSVSADSSEMSLREARLTLLRAVAEGKLSPEDAEKLLFKS